MLTSRIIACLDCSGGIVVKGTRFQNLVPIGDPAELARAYESQGADEIVLLDIDASRLNLETRIATAKAVRKVLSIPLTVGGGIKKLTDIELFLECGADKVSINSAAIRNPSLVEEASKRFGAQCIVIAIDAIKTNDSWKATLDGGTITTEVDVLDWASTVASLGAGEILLTSFDRDGTRLGYDLSLIKGVRSVCNIPIIASGGASNSIDLLRGLEAGADAVLIASMLHFNSTTVSTIKNELIKAGVAIRV